MFGKMNRRNFSKTAAAVSSFGFSSNTTPAIAGKNTGKSAKAIATGLKSAPHSPSGWIRL